MKLPTSSFKVFEIIIFTFSWCHQTCTIAMQLNNKCEHSRTILSQDYAVSIQISHYKFGIYSCIKQQSLWISCVNPESIQTYLPMNKILAYSTLITHHLHHQEQESWSTTSLKREQHMLLMDHMDGTLAEHQYTTDASNFT